MNRINDFAKALGQRGGVARAKRLSPAERSRIASMGGRAKALSLQVALRIEENFRYLQAIEKIREAVKQS